MGQRGRISFPPDGRLVELLDARREAMITATGEDLSRSALIRMLLRQALGEPALQAALTEAHFRLGPAIRRALGKLAQEMPQLMQSRLAELVDEELHHVAED